MVSTETIARLDVAQLEIGARHAQHEIRQATAVFTTFKVHAESSDVQTRLFFEG